VHKIKSHKTVEQIAKKHRLDVSFVRNQLRMGIPVEHEHTKDKDLATDIALQHLDEIPDYYTRLRKMESSAKKQHKKFKDVKEEIDSLRESRRDNKGAGDPGYSLRDWFKGGGWIQVSGKYKGKPCAKQPGQKTKPFCRDADDAAAMSTAEKKRRTAKKRKEDPNPNRRGKAKMVREETCPVCGYDPCQCLEGSLHEKKDACYHKVKSRYKVWPSAYASGALVKCRNVGAKNWGTTTEAIEMIRYCPKCEKNETRNECKYGTKYWDMYSLPISLGKKYTPNTPHPGNFPESYDHEHSMARSELATIMSAAKRIRKKMKGEGNIEAWVQSKITKAADYLDAAADYIDSGEMKEQVADTDTMSDKKPFDIAVQKIMKRKEKMTPVQRVTALKQAGKLQGVDEQMLPPINPEAHKRAQKTQKLFNKGTSTDNPNEKEIFLKKTGPQLPLAKKETKTQVAHYEPEGEVIDEKCWPGYKKKGMKTMFGKRYPNCVKKEGYSDWRAELLEDWQKVNRKDKTDGLSPAAVKAYRRENPGSKLQTAVTEKNPEGKRAKRRASFCRRMSGMKSKLTSAKTARDPDSRINKALRRWRCN